MSAGFRFTIEGPTRVLWLEEHQVAEGEMVRAMIDVEMDAHGEDFMVDLGGMTTAVGARLERLGCRSRNPGLVGYSVDTTGDGGVRAACTCGWRSEAFTNGGLAGAAWDEHNIDAHDAIDLR